MTKQILKTITTIILFIGLTIVVHGQEVQFSRALITSGGSSSGGKPVNVTRWRIGQINVITLSASEIGMAFGELEKASRSPEISDILNFKVFPNPVTDILKVQYNMQETGKYAYELIDFTGRKLIVSNPVTVMPGQVSEINLKGFAPAFYMLRIIPGDTEPDIIYKITKL